MPQVVSCRCGQSFEAADYLAGQVVACPVCHTPLAIPPLVVAPPPPPSTRPVYSGQTRACPSCGRPTPIESPSCVHCWYAIALEQEKAAARAQWDRRQESQRRTAAAEARRNVEISPQFVHTVVGVSAHAITLSIVAVVYASTGDWVAAGYIGAAPGWLAVLTAGPLCGIFYLLKQTRNQQRQQQAGRLLLWSQVICLWGWIMGMLGGLIAKLIGGYGWE